MIMDSDESMIWREERGRECQKARESAFLGENNMQGDMLFGTGIHICRAFQGGEFHV
jgi:hypothetical protein